MGIFMTSAWRKEVRRPLVALGFVRATSTQDQGDGRYEEVWVFPGGARVTIQWDVREEG